MDTCFNNFLQLNGDSKQIGESILIINFKSKQTQNCDEMLCRLINISSSFQFSEDFKHQIFLLLNADSLTYIL